MFNVNRSDTVDLVPHNEREAYLQIGPLLFTVNNTGPHASARTSSAHIGEYLAQQQAV